MAFDEIWQKAQDGITLRYGVVDGNDTIVLIKSGCGGSYDGYAHKYERMARRIHAARGYSVITADNPEDLFHSHQTDRAVIEQYANQRGFVDYTLMLVGHSDGGGQILRLAQKLPRVKKMLGINPSSMDTDIDRLRALPQVEKILVYGTEDDEYTAVAKLQAAQIENLRILTVEGANHKFKDMLDEFITQIDLLNV